MPIEKDIVNRTPIRDELRSGESVIVKNEYGEVYEATNIDGIIYKTPLVREDEPVVDGVFEITEDGDAEVTGGDDGAIVISPTNNTMVISDNQGNSRVILGRTSSTPTFGIRIQDHNEAIIAQVEGTTSTTASIGGWDITTTTLSNSGVTLGGVTDNGYLGIGVTTYNANDGIFLGETSAGVHKFSIKNSDGSKYFRFTDAAFEVDAGNFSIDASGNIVATGGTIAGWDMGTNLLRSAASGARIELNKAKNRTSIFDASNEKIVMGYLEGLVKNNSVGLQITAIAKLSVGETLYEHTVIVTIGSITDDEHENAFPVNISSGAGKLIGLDFWLAAVNGARYSGQAAAYNITANTFNTITITLDSSAAIYPVVNTAFSGGTYDYIRLEYESDDYGFWVLEGDKMVIDGDVEYDSGDWLIESDGALKFIGNGVEVMRLGTFNGKKGLYIGDVANDNTIVSLFDSSQARLGVPTGDHVLVDSTSIKFKSAGIVLGELNAESWTLGQAAEARVIITNADLQIINVDNIPVVRIQKGGLDTVGEIIIGDTNSPDNPHVHISSSALTIKASSASNSDYSSLTAGNLVFSHFVSTTEHQFPYMFSQYISEADLNLGSAFTFATVFPGSVNLEVIFSPKIIQVYKAANTSDDQHIGYYADNLTTTGFTPRAKLFIGGYASVSITLAASAINDSTCTINPSSSYEPANLVFGTTVHTNSAGDKLSDAQHDDAVDAVPPGLAENEVNKITLKFALSFTSGGGHGPRFYFVLRVGNGTAAYSGAFLEAGYQEFVFDQVVGISGTSYTYSFTWAKTLGDFSEDFKWELVWYDEAENGNSSLAVTLDSSTPVKYESIPEYDEITGTGKCAALVVGY